MKTPDDSDWVIMEDGWVHKEELKPWPVEKIDPELWTAIEQELPDWTDAEKRYAFWQLRDFRQFLKEKNHGQEKEE